MNHKLLLLISGCMLLLTLYTENVYAQTTQASFTGKISDTENKPLAGATVLVKNESTGFTASTHSNTKGDFVFKELPLGGPYYILVTSVGFAEQKKPGYTLNQGDVVTIDVTLKTSNAKELTAVTVTAIAGSKGKIEKERAGISYEQKQ